MRKIFSIILSVCICLSVAPLSIISSAETVVSAQNVDILIDSASFTYEFKDTKEGSAAGVLSFDFGNLPQDSVSSIKFYFTDINSTVLSGYSYITEFSTSYKYALSNGSVYNGIAAAADGFTFGEGTVLPFGASGVCAIVTVETDDGSIEKTVSDGKYITTVEGISAIDTTLPEFKKSSVDFTTDLNNEEKYQLFVMADYHNYYAWNPDSEQNVDYSTIAYKYVSSDGKDGAPQGKALYAVNKILDADEKSVGTITIGDIINDKSDGSGSSGEAESGSYNAVLASYYQAGLMDYMNFFAVGNHDIIMKHATEDNNYFLDFMALNGAENQNSIDNFSNVSNLSEAVEYYYDFYIENDHYIVMSSPHDGNYYSETQLKWVENLLIKDNSNGVRSIIINHEPMMNTEIYATSEYMADAPALKKIIEDNSTNHKTVWFSGHTHVTYYDNVQNVSLYGVDNISYVGIPHIMNTSTRKTNVSQGMQVKVYDDKLVLIGRSVYENGAYSTNILPSAIYVLDYEDDIETSKVTVSADTVTDGSYPTGSTLTATVDGIEALSYQWYIGGNAIEGATSSTYTVTNDISGGRLSVKVNTGSGNYYGISKYIVIPNTIYISSAEELMQIGIVNSMPLSGSYVLTADIDFSDIDFKPIGYHSGSLSAHSVDDSTIFTGTFDGGGHVISDITCHVSSSKFSYSALFGALKNATVKNLVLKNCSFSAYNDGNQSFAAAIAGLTVSSSSAPYSTTISNISVEDCKITSTICNVKNNIGAAGLVGYSESGVSISDCYIDADITATLGGSTTSVSNRISASGLVAVSYDGKVTASNCVVVGSIDASDYSNGEFVSDISNTKQNIILAYNNKGQATSPGIATATNCYYIDTVKTNVLNVLGLDGTLKSAEELSYITPVDLSLNSELWYKAKDCVKLKISPDYRNDRIEIYSANELSKIGQNGYPMDGNYVLMNDIVLSDFDVDNDSENGNWKPIGGHTSYDTDVAFKGNLDGQNHKIIGLKVINNSKKKYLYGGLFGVTHGQVNISNLIFDDCHIELHADTLANAGIVAGRAQHDNKGGMTVNNIAVINCSVNIKSDNANNPSAAASIVGQAHYVTINNCYSNAKIIGGCTVSASNQFGLAGIIAQSWHAEVSVNDCVFVGIIDDSQHAGGGYIYRNGIFAMNLNHPTYATNHKAFTDCYYNNTLLTVSQNTNGGSVDGVGLSSNEFSIKTVDELGLDSAYWRHDGKSPILSILGEDYYTLAEVNGVFYKTLGLAVEAASDGSTVILHSDAAGDGIVIDKDITIDFGGFTYTVTTPVGSTGTVSNGFLLIKDNNITFKNGTLTIDSASADKFYILIQNYSNLTVTDMTLDGTYLDNRAFTDGDSYVLSNYCGNVTINGATDIIANNDGTLANAFAVCKYADYSAPTVEINTTGEIKGRVEVTDGLKVNLVVYGGKFVGSNIMSLATVADGFALKLVDGIYTVTNEFSVADIDNSKAIDAYDIAYITNKLLGRTVDENIFDIDGSGAFDIIDLIKIKKLAAA